MNKEELRKEFAEETGIRFNETVAVRDIEIPHGAILYGEWLESKLTTKQESVKCGICIQNEINAERGVFGFNGQCTCFTVPTTHPKQPQQTVSDEEIRMKAEKYFMENIKPLHDAFDSMDMVYGVMMEKEIDAIANLMRDKLQAQTNVGELIELMCDNLFIHKLRSSITNAEWRRIILAKAKALQNTNKD